MQTNRQWDDSLTASGNHKSLRRVSRAKIGIALMLMLLAAPAFAQRYELYNVSVQDDSDGYYLLFNSVSGQFKFVDCASGVTLTGQGNVKTDGCSVYLTYEQAKCRVLASVNICEQQGKAVVEVLDWIKAKPPIPPMQKYITDSDMQGNSSSCSGALPPIYRAKLPPSIEPAATEIIVQNDADGSFLVFNTGSGEYKFVHCEDGALLSGAGIVKTDGCALYLEDAKKDYRVLASINLCAMEGKAAIEVFVETATAAGPVHPLKEYISDNTLRDNTTQCGPKK